MASPLTESQFVRLLDDRLTKVSEDAYGDLPTMIPRLFNVMSTEKAWEEFFSIGAVPDIPRFTGQLDYLSIAPGFHIKIEPAEFAAGIQFERKLIEDKRYNVLESKTAGLMKAAKRTQDKTAARLFQYAFSASFDFQTNEEGVALCSNSHTTKSGTSTSTGFDNLGTTALSKTSLAAARIAMTQFRNDISERIDMDDSWILLVPSNLADTAWEIVNTQRGYEASTTAAMKENSAYDRYKVVEYMRLDDVDTNNWFLINESMMKDHLFWMDRVKPEFNTDVDFETFILKASVYFRCACGWTDWRWIYGSQVS